MDPRRTSETEAGVRRTRNRSIATLKRTMATLENVLDSNRLLADWPEHRSQALQRIAEGEAERDALRAELARLEEDRDRLGEG